MKNITGLIRSTNHMFFDTMSEEHVIDKRTIPIVIDGDALDRLNTRLGIGLEGSHGFSTAKILYFAREEDFPEGLPKTGAVQMFDNRRCTVEDARNDAGILRIVLSQPRG